MKNKCTWKWLKALTAHTATREKKAIHNAHKNSKRSTYLAIKTQYNEFTTISWLSKTKAGRKKNSVYRKAI